MMAQPGTPMNQTPQIHHHQQHSHSSLLYTVSDVAALIAVIGPYPVILDRHQRRWTIVEIVGDDGSPVLRARPLAGPADLAPPTGTPTAAALLASAGPLLPTTAQPVPTGNNRSVVGSIDRHTANLLWGRLPAREWFNTFAVGWAESPIPDHPVARWQWYAEILYSPIWGMATIAAEHHELFQDGARLCRTISILSADADHPAASADTVTAGNPRCPNLEHQWLEREWRAVEAAVMSAIAGYHPTPACSAAGDPVNGRGVFEALDTLGEITTDALEWLRGRLAVGLEAPAVAFDALLYGHSHAAGRALLIAVLIHTLTVYPASTDGRAAATGPSPGSGQFTVPTTIWRTAS